MQTMSASKLKAENAKGRSIMFSNIEDSDDTGTRGRA